MNMIGLALGVKMAKASLRFVHGQIRFLSEFFLNKFESLVHGAELYSAFLEENDTAFVQSIEDENRAREWFTFQVTIETIKFKYPDNWDKIIEKFVKMLLFDAIIGNNDRHFYNWGVIEDVYGNKTEFSPVYDTARGLFWNFNENKVNTYFVKGIIDKRRLMKYLKRSSPKIGWEGIKEVSHFELIEKIYVNYPQYRRICNPFLSEKAYQNVIGLIDKQFVNFLSKNRCSLIKKCLELRFKELQNLCNV